MATKDFLFNDKLTGFGDILKNNNDQFMNLNLNQNNNGSKNHGLIFSKKNSNDFKTSLLTSFSNTGNDINSNNMTSNKWRNEGYSRKLSKPLIMKKDTKHDFSNVLKKDDWLSLHIKAYENSLEASTASNSDGNNSCRKLTKKEIILKELSSPALQNPFEFPRQQKEEKKDPEITQFKSSQKLLNPESDAISGAAIDISKDKNIEVDKLEDVSLREYFFPDSKGKPVTIIRSLGAGSYGSVFHASHNGKDIAAKIEKKLSTRSPSLKRESEIYQLLHAEKCPYIAEYFQFGERQSFLYLLMEKAQKAIDDLKTSNENKIIPVSPDQILIIGYHIMKGIQALHQIGYIHRDLKPQNFLVGNGKKILIADFGVARQIYDKYGEIHGVFDFYKHDTIPKTHKLVGTVTFMSTAAHQREFQSFKEDMESIIYTLDYLQTAQEKFYGTYEDEKKVLKMKKEMKQKNAYFENLPTEMEHFSNNIFETKFDQKPKYGKLEDILENAARRLKFHDLASMPFEEDGKTLKKRKEEFKKESNKIPPNDNAQRGVGPKKKRSSSSQERKR